MAQQSCHYLSAFLMLISVPSSLEKGSAAGQSYHVGVTEKEIRLCGKEVKTTGVPRARRDRGRK